MTARDPLAQLLARMGRDHARRIHEGRMNGKTETQSRNCETPTPRKAQLRSPEQKAQTPMKTDSMWEFIQNLRKESAKYRLENKRLTGALRLAEAERDQLRYQLNHPQEDSMQQFADQLGKVVTATFPGQVIEDADGSPAGMTAIETFTAPVMAMTVTAREADVHDLWGRPGVTIVDPTGNTLQTNPIDPEED